MAQEANNQPKVIERRVRILIADDQAVVRTMVRSTLESDPRFEVCGEAINGAVAIREAQRLKPDVVVLNVTLPVLNGFDAACEIKRRSARDASRFVAR